MDTPFAREAEKCRFIYLFVYYSSVKVGHIAIPNKTGILFIRHKGEWLSGRQAVISLVVSFVINLHDSYPGESTMRDLE